MEDRTRMAQEDTRTTGQDVNGRDDAFPIDPRGGASQIQHAKGWLGSGELTPEDPQAAGEYGTWKVNYTVGIAGIDDGGRIRLAYRSVSDHASPQFDDPAAPNYVSVRASRPVKLTPVFERAGGLRPWAKTLTIAVSEGQLAQGDRVAIVLGDRTGGGPGIRAQTYPERRFTFKLQVDPFGTGLYEHVEDLGYPIVGGAATRLVVTVPSDVVAGEPTWLQMRALDRWGNPDQSYVGEVEFPGNVAKGLPKAYRFTQEDAGIHRFDGVRFEGTNTAVILALDEASGLSATSNPVRCHAKGPSYRVFWGDLHGQTEETLGTGSVTEYFDYARDVSAVDVIGHSGNDFQITEDGYEHLRENVESFYEPGRFVTFGGYEWSGNTPAGGDRNVYYFDWGPLRRSSHTLVPDKRDLGTDRYPVDRLHEANVGREDVLLVPHIGGRRSNLDYHDPNLEPVVEIASQWGRFEWFAREALERGMRVGFIGGSDDHSGRPGWSALTLAHHGLRGGLTAFLATGLDRESIWEALFSRRCYGTSGPRILLDVSVDGQPMGAELAVTEPPLVQARVLGTAPLDTVELRRGTETVYTFPALPPVEQDKPPRLRVAWRGARNRDRSRALDWSGELAVWGGSITAAQNYGTDSPLDGIIDWNDERVTWRSHTCGDWDGVIVDLDGDGDTRVAFSSPMMSFDFPLSDLDAAPVRHTGPGLEQEVVVRRLPHADGFAEASFDWRDESPTDGVNPYWIWVTQSDGEFAWSSPVYVTWEG